MPAASPVPTLSQIEAWDTSHLNTAATFWTRNATAWEDAFNGVHQQMSRPGGTAWEGVAADAALNRALGDLAKVQGLAEQLRTAAATARSGAGDLYAAQQRAISAVDQARAAGFDVSEDLSVTSRRTGGDALMQTIRQAHAKLHTANIRAQAVALAAIDQQVATRIATAAAGVGKVGFAEAPIYTRTPKKRNGIQAVDYKQSPIPEPGPPDLPGASEGRTAADLRAATGYLPQGTRPSIKLVRSEEELRRLWNWATENAPERTGSSHPGTQRVLAGHARQPRLRRSRPVPRRQHLPVERQRFLQ